MNENFIDSQRRLGVKILFSSVQLPVNVENYGVRSQHKYNIVVEKMDLKDLIQIRLTEASDQSKMYISTIDNSSYERIKMEQSLHVTYQGFIDHMTNILESCKRSELHLALVNDKNVYLLQFYEKSSFKNLTHLFLVMDVASTETILFHINQSLQSCQDQNIGYMNQVQKYQLEINARDETIQKLQLEGRTLSAKLVEQENMIFNRNAEEVNRLHQTIKHVNESKELEEKRLKTIISGMQEKIDLLTKEAHSHTERFLQESKQIESVREEQARLRSQNMQLKEECDRMKAKLHSHQGRDGKHEATIGELRQQLIELESTAKLAEKQKSRLEAELEAEKCICQTKKHALQLTTDELVHANVVIHNLNKELMKLKSKVDLRTEVAMRQEKLIQEKDKQHLELTETVAQIQQEHIRNRAASEEYAQTVRRIKETSDVIEEKYRKKINDLILKISGNSNTDIITPPNRHLRPHFRKE